MAMALERLRETPAEHHIVWHGSRTDLRLVPGHPRFHNAGGQRRTRRP